MKVADWRERHDLALEKVETNQDQIEDMRKLRDDLDRVAKITDLRNLDDEDRAIIRKYKGISFTTCSFLTFV